MTEERSADLSVINFSVNRLLRGGALDRDDATQARLDSEWLSYGAGDVPEAETVWHKSTAKGLEEADRKMGDRKRQITNVLQASVGGADGPPFCNHGKGRKMEGRKMAPRTSLTSARG